MAQQHVWYIKDKYFNQHKNGDKDIEARVGYPSIKKAKPGDTLTFANHEADKFQIVRVSVYPSFEAMLKKEDCKRILPGASSKQTLKTLERIYPKNKEALGVYAIELKLLDKRSQPHNFFKVSDLLKNGDRREFSRVIAECYSITDWISKDYPEHCAHFYGKYVPGLFNGSREIIACQIGKKIVAVAFLKKALEATELGPNGHSEVERKISTLFVNPDYRKNGIAHELLRRSFDWLGTTKPLASIAEYKLEQFSGIIKKYGWKETQILQDGYYADNSREHVFNGRIA